MYHVFRRPTILVTGATGAQGGAVARHLLADGRWTVRALTRNPGSSAARTLRDAGVEIAVGDLDDPSSLRDAMTMCHGVYGVAGHGAPPARRASASRALVHGHTLARAAAAAGIKHLVLECGLEATVAQLQALHGRDRGRPMTFVRAAFHYENLLRRYRPRPNRDDGGWTVALPPGDVRLAAVSAEDVGGVVATLFARRDEFAGHVVGVVGDERPADEYARALGRLTSQRVRHVALPAERHHESYAARPGDVESSRRLFPRLRTLEEWARDHARELAPLFVAERVAARAEEADAVAA